MNGRRIDFMGCPLDALTMEETLAEIARQIASRRPHQHVVVNAAKIVAMADDVELRRVIAGCDLVNADGQSIVWAARLLGLAVPERVAGIDLMLALMERAEREGWSVYFLGAEETVVQRTVEILCRRHPHLKVAGWRNGYFRDEEEGAIAASIRDGGADILLAAMPSPRKERFLERRRAEMRVPFCMGVGGSFDVVAGKTRRAPRWMQRAGLEWFHRFLQEPRRMWRRYLTTNTRFLFMVVRARLTGWRLTDVLGGG